MRLPKAQPGDLFAVPLDRGGFGLGLVTRVDGKGGALGFFFGPKQSEPRIMASEDIRPDLAVLAVIFGDTALLNGAWPRLGRLAEFSRDQWPTPLFSLQLRIGDDLTPAKCFEYADDDTLWNSRQVPCPERLSMVIGREGHAPNGYVEGALTDLLDPPLWQQP